jgi:hypothetical protein
MKKTVSRSPVRRPKPTVAFCSEENARRNIQAKVGAIRELLDAGARPPDVPTSLRQFNAWSRPQSKDCGALHRNANETLARHLDLSSAVRSLVRLTKAVAKPQVRQRDAGLARTRERSEVHKVIRQIAEAELLRSRADNTRLRAELEALRAQVDSMTEEADRIRREYEEEIAKLRVRNAEVLRARRTNVRIIPKDE